MKGLVPAPKGRDARRTPVGHKYLEALQARSHSNAGSDTSSSSSLERGAEQNGPGLDFLILGVTSGTAMDEIDFALCRFTQTSPEAALELEIIQVCPNYLPKESAG